MYCHGLTHKLKRRAQVRILARKATLALVRKQSRILGKRIEFQRSCPAARPMQVRTCTPSAHEPFMRSQLQSFAGKQDPQFHTCSSAHPVRRLVIPSGRRIHSLSPKEKRYSWRGSAASAPCAADLLSLFGAARSIMLRKGHTDMTCRRAAQEDSLSHSIVPGRNSSLPRLLVRMPGASCTQTLQRATCKQIVSADSMQLHSRAVSSAGNKNLQTLVMQCTACLETAGL